MKFTAYHKIRQFKDIIRDISFKSNIEGIEKPVLVFNGTVKLHGTNAQICYDGENLLAGKRSSLLNEDELTSHFGFNQFVQVEKKDFLEYNMKRLYDMYCLDGEQIIIYGEWAGIGIQKNVAISEIGKGFYMFDCKIYNPNTEKFRWIDIRDIELKDSKIYNVSEFDSHSIAIDFNNPGLSQNELVKITEDIENECPVAKALGSSGIGEGAVWQCHWKGEKYIFKVKGEKHSVTKVKKLASIDPEKIVSINNFIDYACTVNRINQGISEVGATDKKHMPDLLRWVANDIISEETDTMVANNLEWKQVAKECSHRVRQHFFEILNKI